VTAQPTEDPADPLVTLRDLPERERSSSGSTTRRSMPRTTRWVNQRLRRLLREWSVTAVAAGQPGYYEELAAARAGTATTVPVTDAIPDWAERVAAARGRQ
jgi:hypothetical protein